MTMNYKRALLRMGQEIGQRDLENLKFGCRDAIPESRREHIHAARDLFSALEEKGLLSPEKLDYLARQMVDIGRPGLLSHLEAFGFTIPDLHRALSPTEADSSSETPFTRCLLQISQKLLAEEVDRLAFAWCGNFLMISPDKIYSANQLFNLMNQRMIIKPDNMQVLYIELNEMGRQDLCKMIEDYYHTVGMSHQPYNGIYSPSPVPSLYREDNGYPRSSQDHMCYYSNGQIRPNDLSFPSSPAASMTDLNSQMSQLQLSSIPSSTSSPSQNGSFRKGSLSSVPPLVETFHCPPPIYNSDQSARRPSSAASGNNDGSTNVQRNISTVVQPQFSYDGELEHQQQINMLLSQKESELEEIKRQMAHEHILREQEMSSNVRSQEIQVLQEALQLKNREVNELRMEMSILRAAPLSSIPHGIAIGDLYNMTKTPHGICLIINNYEFYQGDPKYERLTDRSGAQKDQENLVETFKFLKYEIDLRENLTSEKMVDTLKDISCRDHTPYDSFICCILTHGEEGVVFGADSRPVSLRDLTGIVKGTFTRSLMNKPKLFFVQACRGDREERGIPVEKDGDTSLPVEADFLFGYATPTGKAAYRSRRHGSWFISELCEVFKEDSMQMPLGAMMKKINRRVSDAYTKEGYKQCTEVVDRLRKDVMFFPLERTAAN